MLRELRLVPERAWLEHEVRTFRRIARVLTRSRGWSGTIKLPRTPSWCSARDAAEEELTGWPSSRSWRISRPCGEVQVARIAVIAVHIVVIAD